MGKKTPLPDFRRSMLRWNEGRKVKWLFTGRFSPHFLSSADALMRERHYHAALFLMLVGLEILSGFFEGRSPDAGSVCTFARRYMEGVLSARPAPCGKAHPSFLEIIWAVFRRGFAGSGAAHPAGSVTARSRYYCRRYSRAGLRLDVHKFHRDFIRAYHRYYSDVWSDYLVRQKFVKRFDELCGRTQAQH